eukprot:3213206-Rhodomonas_salina.1
MITPKAHLPRPTTTHHSTTTHHPHATMSAVIDDRKLYPAVFDPEEDDQSTEAKMKKDLVCAICHLPFTSPVTVDC